MKKLRIYADTSVFGGCFDEEFVEASNRFFDEVRAGRFQLVVSETVVVEHRLAPENVRALFEDLRKHHAQMIEESEAIESLRDAYIRHGVVGESSLMDAEHIAAASVARVDVLVIWNFRDIVNFHRIQGYRAVNLLEGYAEIRIHTPREVMTDDA